MKENFDKLVALLARYRVQLTLVVGAVICLFGLGREGLWEPWEMDRAALARNMVEAPAVPIALGDSRAAIQAPMLEAADQAGVVLRFATPPRAGARGIAAGARTLQEAVADAKNDVVGAIVLDIALLADNPAEPASWNGAATRLLEATKFAPNAHVILVGGGDGLNAETVRTNAVRAAVKAQLESVSRGIGAAAALTEGPQLQSAIDQGVQSGIAGDNIRVVLGADAGQLSAALADSASEGAWIARFKLNGETRTMAPLETWATAISYNLFGTTEFATRLPGALLALLTLVVLVLVTRRIWGDRTATLAGLVCATTPLYFAQARSATGETGAMLALALVAAALLLHTHNRHLQGAGGAPGADVDEEPRPAGAGGAVSDRTIWLLFALGLVVGLLSKGLFSLLTATALTGGLVLVTPDPLDDKRGLKLAAVAAGVLAVVWLWVSGGSSHGFASMFGLGESLFSTGPTAYTRNFDLVVHQIGFGTMPWAPFLVVVFGGFIYYAAKRDDRRALVTVLWFGLPVVLMMLFLKDYNQLLWPAAPAGALAIALALDQIWTKGHKSHVATFLLFVMFVILLKELGDSPQPLASFLTFDPPFAKQGAGRFPETLQLSSLIKLGGWALLLFGMIYFSRLIQVLIKVANYFRETDVRPTAAAALAATSPPTAKRAATPDSASSAASENKGHKAASKKDDAPAETAKPSAPPEPVAAKSDIAYWASTALIAWAFVTLGLLLRALLSYSSAMGTTEAGGLAPHQRGFASLLLFSTDPVNVAFWVTTIGAVAVWIFRWIPAWNRRLRGVPADEAWAPRWLAFLATGSQLQTRAVLVTAAAWGALGISMFLSVETPPDYFGEILGGGSLALVGLGAVAGFVWVRFGLGEQTRVAALFAAGTIGLFLGANFMRDAWHFPWYATLFSIVGAAGVFVAALPSLWRDGRSFFRAGLMPTIAFTALLAMPLLSRYDEMLPIIAPTSGESQITYILTKSRITTLTLIALLGLAANRYLLPPLLRWTESRKVRPAGGDGVGATTLSDRLMSIITLPERGPVAVVLIVVMSFVFAGGAIASFFPALSENVSQKHIVDTYRAAMGLSDNALGDNIFKHGSFATANRGDSNFYTANIPEIRDRNAALQVLLGQKDMGVQVETPAGTRVVPIQGWIHDAAQKRAYGGIVGIATQVEAGKLVDEQAKWNPGEHKGKLLVDSRGRTYPISDNDATSITLAGGQTPHFSPTRPQDNFYAIDDPNAANHAATAKDPLRYYFLMPADNFSGINHAFRKLSRGRHIPVIDGRSYRVLLTASWLGEGEENDNRYAKHTLTREEFDRLDAPNMMRAKKGSYLTNFDDTVWIVGFSTTTPLVSRGDTFQVTVYYQCIKEVRASYQVFMHIDKRGSSNRIHSDHWPLNLTQGGEDDKSCTGCYRTDHWLPGDVIVDVYENKVPAGNPSGIQDVWTGLYRPSGGARMKVKDWDKAQVQHDGSDRVRLGHITVR